MTWIATAEQHRQSLTEERGENVPDSEFDWYRVDDDSYLWTAHIEVTDEGIGYRAEPDSVAEKIPPSEPGFREFRKWGWVTQLTLLQSRMFVEKSLEGL